MEQQIQNSQPNIGSKWTKTGLVLDWIFGIIFAMLTLGVLIDLSYGAITLFLCAALTLPPLQNYIKTKFKIPLPAWIRIILIIILLFISQYIFKVEQ
jgi:hypothetical protein